MDVNQKYLHIKPVPPYGLDVTSVGIWVSWTKMTDKEIMRENAMKGTTSELAVKFLSRRNEWTVAEAEHWLRMEIEMWALDLLNRGQIHKAMHIYQTSGKDAFDEIRKVLFATTVDQLREKLKGLMIKNDKWTEDYDKCWILFGAICKENRFTDDKMIKNLQYVYEQSDDWKSTIGTKIFFMTYDFELEPFLDSETAWIFLLKENPRLIKFWIKVLFDTKITEISSDVDEKLIKAFKKLKITQQMIDSLSNIDISIELQQEILGEFCRYGVFNSNEQKDIKSLINRVVRSSNIYNLKELFLQPHSSINLDQFSKLLISYCIQNNLLGLLNFVVNFINLNDFEIPYIKLMLSTKEVCETKSYSAISNNLIEVSQYLSKDDLLFQYFDKNPIILLGILLFQKHALYDILAKQSNTVICGVKPSEILTTFDLLILEHDKIRHKIPPKLLTHLDLLEKHSNVNVQMLYRHRYFNNVESFNFSNTELVEKFGYQKEVNFLFFLKQLKPCYAYKLFISKQKQSNLNQNYITSCEKVEQFAIKHILNKELVSACIGFIEMLNGKSYALRVHVSVAEIILKSKIIDENQFARLFEDIDMNAEEILNSIQSGIVKNFKNVSSEMKGRNLIKILKQFDVLIKFSSLHNIKPPDVLLKLFAERDLWLEFLIFIQIYNYPSENVLKSIQRFKTPSISEHMEHCFKNDMQQDEERDVRKERDIKKYFFSKIGLRASERYTPSEVSSLSSYGSMSNSVESDILEADALNDKTELLLLFIKCHNSVDPPKAFQFACRYYRRPLLAVFATCYEPDSLLTNWLTWLEVSCNVDITHFNSDIVIESESVLNCFRSVLSEGYFKTLLQSYFIFLNENPLRYFLEFIIECLRFNFNETTITNTISYFSNKLIKVRRNSFIGEFASDIHFVNNKVWIQNTAIYVIGLTLQYGYENFFDKISFVKFLCDIEICKHFSVSCPNFKTILKILEYLFENNCDIPFDLSVINNQKKFRKEIENFIIELVNQKEFNAALNLAEISDLPMEQIIVEQVQYEFESKREYYWLEVEEIFKNSSFDAKRALDFFEEMAEKAEGFEKYAILKVAYNWCKTYKLPEKLSIERLLWLSFFEMENCVNHLTLPDTDYMVFYSEYLEELEKIKPIPYVMSETQTKNLFKTVEVLLNYRDLKRSLRLTKIFGYTITDLDILKLCMMLAEGMVLATNLTFEQRLLLIKRGPGIGKHLRRTSTRLISVSSTSYNPSSTAFLNLSDYQQTSSLNETLTIMETLAENLTNGNAIASRIVRSYRCSINLKTKYKDVLRLQNPLTILKDALSNDCSNKLEVVGDFINIFQLSKQQIADLICAELVDAISVYSKSAIDTYFLWDVNIEINFTPILQLLVGDCTILGTKLFNLASTTHQSQMQKFVSNEDYTLISELLIKSHDCFTADCNMEGISMVLKKCQTVIASLLTVKNWKLIIRLLTSIKRYSEMNYVFPILKENDQFELLLRKGSRKDVGLKTALLEYLKKYCPEDIELYKIVALHFFLFSEIAELWEQESVLLIKRLIQIAKMDVVNNKVNSESDKFVYFANSEDTKNILSKIMKNYRHASEYHLNGSKVAKSLKTAQQAKLVALQISLFKNLIGAEPCVCLFKLSKNQINKLLLEHLNFFQALILIKAYDYKTDWAPILFEQYVVKSSPNYLNNFLSAFELSNNLLHEVSRKFLSYSNPTNQMVENMKNVLTKLTSVHTKYRIASELGFSDIVESLLEGNQLCYLKDTVWKNGYRDSEP